jgi:hypothetical protein
MAKRKGGKKGGKGKSKIETPFMQRMTSKR